MIKVLNKKKKWSSPSHKTSISIYSAILVRSYWYKTECWRAKHVDKNEKKRKINDKGSE